MVRKGKPPQKKRPTAAEKIAADNAKQFRQQEWAKEQARRQKTKTKKLMRGLTKEKIDQLKQFKSLHPLVVRQKVELAIVESMPDLAKKASLGTLINLKFELRKVVTGEGLQRRFEMLIEAVKPMLERQKKRFIDLEARTRGGPLHKKWNRRLKKVNGLLEKTDSFTQRVATAGSTRGGTINRIIKSRSIWMDFLKETEDAFQFGLGAKESRDFFNRQMKKVREEVKF
jgi:hypothetical protein